MLFGLLAKLTHYFDNGLNCFTYDSKQKLTLTPVNKEHTKVWMLMVARRHYTELNRSYPLEKRSEVKKLIKLEYQGQRVFYKIAKVDNGKTQVNIWVFDSQLPQALITLPESLLFSTLLSNNQILKVNSQATLFVAKHKDIVSSQMAGALITNSQSFAMAIGLSSDAKVNELVAEGRPIELLTALKRLGITDLSLFFALPSVNPSSYTIKKVLLPASLIFVVYLLGSSAYLLGYKAYLQSQINNQSEGINTALDASADMDVQLERYQQIQRFMAKQKDVAAVWLVMSGIFPEAELSRFQLEQGRFVLAGQTARATSLLEKLNDHPYVEDARFDNPTRSSRGKEYFVISFRVGPLANNITVKEDHSNDAGN